MIIIFNLKFKNLINIITTFLHNLLCHKVKLKKYILLDYHLLYFHHKNLEILIDIKKKF